MSDDFTSSPNCVNPQGITEQTALDKNTVQAIATLAHLELSTVDCEALVPELKSILTLLNQLGAADTSTIEPLYHPLDLYSSPQITQTLRPDTVEPLSQTQALSARETFQQLACETSEGFYLVPKVIE